MATINPLEFFLISAQPETVFTGLVSSKPTDPFLTVLYDNGVTGSFGNPLVGQTVWFGTTSGGQERGTLRLKEFVGTDTGTIRVSESDDVGPIIQENDFITIKNEFRLWPKYPRFVQGGTNVTITEDFDVPNSNQLEEWRPIAVVGPPGVGFLEGGQAVISFIGDRSFALADGATLTSFLWTALDSTEGTSSSQGTEASPVTFTWTTEGWHLVNLVVTDSNGNTHKNYGWAVIIDPTNPTSIAFLNFDPISDSFDRQQGGGESSFTVRGDISISQFPEEAMVLHVARGTQTTVTGSWPFRENLLFAGWILSDSVRQNPEQGDVSFRAGTIDKIMKNLSMFPASLTDKITPADWTEGKLLTVDRVASYLWEYRSTLSLMTSIQPSNYTGLVGRQDFGAGNLYSELDNQLMRSIWGKVVSSHQSVLYHTIDYNLQNTAERATATTRKLLSKGVWVNDVEIQESSDYEWVANQVKMSGIFYPGGQVEDVCPLFTEAPGDAFKVYGNETNFDRLILTSQSDLNLRAGHALEQLNERFPIYRMEFINDGSFNPAVQDLFPVSIESTDNDRGLTVSRNLIARRMNRSYDHVGGFYLITVDFEPEISGQPGVTVELDCTPPEQLSPPLVPLPPPEALPGLVSLMASTTGSSYYFAPGVQTSWVRRVEGLATNQLGILDLIADPWSAFKQGAGAEKTIAWAVGAGFLVRSKDAGKNWSNRSDYVPSGAWPGETGTVLSDQNLIALQASIFSEDQLFILNAWQTTDSVWHGAIVKTEDGFTFVNHNITGSTSAKPLGLSMDNGNGQSVYVTVWEGDSALATGTVNLRRYQLSDMSLLDTVALTQATVAEMDSQVRFAHPFNRRNQTGELFVSGQMFEPQGFTGTVQAMKNTSSGATGSWSVIEDTFGSQIIGAFAADADENYYAVRQADKDARAAVAFLAVGSFTPDNSASSFLGILSGDEVDTDKFIYVYHNTFGGGGVDYFSVVATTSGGIVSLGAESSSIEAADSQFREAQVTSITTAKAVVMYAQDASPFNTRLRVLGISGTTITVNSSLDLGETGGNWKYALDKIDSTHVFAVVNKSGAPDSDIRAYIVTEASNVLTKTNVLSIDATAEPDRSLGCNVLNGTNAFVFYEDTANDIMVALIDVSGADPTLTDGPDVIAAGTFPEDKSVDFNTMRYVGKISATLDTTRAVVGYSSGGDTFIVAVKNNGGTIEIGAPLNVGAIGRPVSIVKIEPDRVMVSTGLDLRTFDVSDTAVTFNNDALTMGSPMVSNNNIILVEHSTTNKAMIAGNDDEDPESNATNIQYAEATFTPVGGGVLARFYQGLVSLVEKFTMIFAGVSPKAITLDAIGGTIVIASDEPTSDPVVSSDSPFASVIASDTAFPTDVGVTVVKWI